MKKSIIIPIFLMLIFSTVNSYAQPPGSINDLFPDTDTLEIESTQPKLFDKYPITHYVFDSEKFGIFDAWATVFKAITNVLFLLTVFISKGVKYILMACFKLNIFDLFASFFNNIVWRFKRCDIYTTN
ncbi:hypothetical protein [Caldisalinibacter kiritimatiensis]|uniref:hypothetical protein n=1 Tax=Caldisalinibacter kiritimatiensis TaxID=1304284 RepID=UPI000550F156|nr:hypothetical protein [Caldisalinibacter kiritimatiensis]